MGVRANVIAYTALTERLSQAKMLSDVKRLFDETGNMSCYPNVVTYTNLIHGLCSEGHWWEAMEILHEMLSHGLVLVMSSHTQESWAGYAKQEDCKKLSSTLLDVMKQQGLEPNEFTYSNLIEQFCKKRKLYDALQLFCCMEERDIVNNIIACNILIGGFCKIGKMVEVMKIFGD